MEHRTTQDLILDLIERSGYFDGRKVVEDLRSNPDAWLAVWPQAAYGASLILRDMGSGILATDTLLVTTTVIKASDVEIMARRWGADEINVVEPPTGEDKGDWSDEHENIKACHVDTGDRPDSVCVVRVWWD